jgi:hypothetical protein
MIRCTCGKSFLDDRDLYSHKMDGCASTLEESAPSASNNNRSDEIAFLDEMRERTDTVRDCVNAYSIWKRMIDDRIAQLRAMR